MLNPTAARRLRTYLAKITLPLVALGAIAVAATAHGDNPLPVISIIVGEHVDQPANGEQCICDDPSIVHVEYFEGNLRLTGLKVGTTLCGFQKARVSNHVYSVQVSAPPSTKIRK